MGISQLIDSNELKRAQHLINTAKIASPPKLLLDLKQELALVNPDKNKIIRMIAEDIGLAAKIIRTINMPSYGLTVEVQSIEHAIALFGLEKLKNFIIQPAYKQALDNSLDGFETISEHSHQIGLMAEIIGVEIDPKMTGMFYLAGLFHDVGSLCLASHYPDYLDFYETNSIACHSCIDIEREKYQVSHPAIGVLLAKHWGLSNEICNAIYLHHTPIGNFHKVVDATTNTLTSTLVLANYYYNKYQTGYDVSNSQESELSYSTSIEELMLNNQTLETIEKDCQFVVN